MPISRTKTLTVLNGVRATLAAYNKLGKLSGTIVFSKVEHPWKKAVPSWKQKLLMIILDIESKFLYVNHKTDEKGLTS